MHAARADRSIDELSAASGINPSVVRDAEAGRPGLTTAQLARLADELRVDVAALHRGEVVRRESPSIFFRHVRYQDFSHADLEVLDSALEQGRMLRYVSRRLGRPAPPSFEHRRIRTLRGKRAARHGYALSAKVRAELQRPLAPLTDLARIIERTFQIAVVNAHLSSARVVASSVRAPDGAAIVLNASDEGRQRNPIVGRVHLAHELCHLLFDPSEGGMHFVYDLADDSDSSALEQRARGFAAELLMPKDGLLELAGAPRRLVSRDAAFGLVFKVRSRFGTPHEITANHLVNHEYIAAEQRESLVGAPVEVEGVEGPTIPEPGKPSVELCRVVAAAHEASLLSDGEARNALGMDILERLPWS